MYHFCCISKTQTLHYVELYCKARICVITHSSSGYVYVMYYFAIITSVMMPCDDSGETYRSCLRVGCHNWYQSIIGIIRHVRLFFKKPTVMKHLDVNIRTIVVLTGGKLTEIYFL
jgi:hypothetical protein